MSIPLRRMPFRLDFEPESTAGLGAALDESAPPAFRLSPPEAGWLYCHVEPPGSGDLTAGATAVAAWQAPIAISDVLQSLQDLWLWTVAVARGLEPVAVWIDEEGTAVRLCAEPGEGDWLRWSLRRRMTEWSDDAAPWGETWIWQESRAAFLARWVALWQTACENVDGSWHEWERDGEGVWPDVARSMPWSRVTTLVGAPVPAWPRQTQVVWFALRAAFDFNAAIVDDLAVWSDEPLRAWSLSLATSNASLRAARWALLESGLIAERTADEAVRPPAVVWDLERLESVITAWIDRILFPSLDEGPFDAEAVDVLRAHEHLTRQVHDVLDGVADAVLAALSLGGEGPNGLAERPSHWRAPSGETVTLLAQRGIRAAFRHDDGRLTVQRLLAPVGIDAGFWPVPEGPGGDVGALDPIDRHRLRRFLAHGGDTCSDCPVCGAPSGEHDADDLWRCDRCEDEERWRWADGALPPLDAPIDAAGDAIEPTLRERRRRYLDHGDVWPWPVVADEDPVPPVDALGVAQTALTGPFAFAPRPSHERCGERNVGARGRARRMARREAGLGRAPPNLRRPRYVEAVAPPLKPLRGLLTTVAEAIDGHRRDIGLARLRRLLPAPAPDAHEAWIDLVDARAILKCPRFGTRGWLQTWWEWFWRQYRGLQVAAIVNGRFVPPPCVVRFRVSSEAPVRVELGYAHGFLPGDRRWVFEPALAGRPARAFLLSPGEPFPAAATARDWWQALARAAAAPGERWLGDGGLAVVSALTACLHEGETLEAIDEVTCDGLRQSVLRLRGQRVASWSWPDSGLRQRYARGDLVLRVVRSDATLHAFKRHVVGLYVRDAAPAAEAATPVRADPGRRGRGRLGLGVAKPSQRGEAGS